MCSSKWQQQVTRREWMPQDVMLPIKKQGVNLAADRLLQVSIKD
jgi:hypothetical protein